MRYCALLCVSDVVDIGLRLFFGVSLQLAYNWFTNDFQGHLPQFVAVVIVGGFLLFGNSPDCSTMRIKSSVRSWLCWKFHYHCEARTSWSSPIGPPSRRRSVHSCAIRSIRLCTEGLL